MEEETLESGNCESSCGGCGDVIKIDLTNAPDDLVSFVKDVSEMAEHYNLAYNEKIKTRSTKARNLLSSIGKACKEMRKSILEVIKNK